MDAEQPTTKAYLVYGPPGSGKTSVCERLCNDLGIAYISIGEITRREVANNSEIGKKLKSYLDIPLEYPLELISEVVESHINLLLGKTNIIILDGYPKYHWEADNFLKYYLSKNTLDINSIIIINISLEESIERINNRFICQDCHLQISLEKLAPDCNCPACSGILTRRVDDERSFVRQRYADYIAAIEPTLEVLKKQNIKVITINGEQPPENIFRAVKSILES